jgi:hypothetical protein
MTIVGALLDELAKRAAMALNAVLSCISAAFAVTDGIGICCEGEAKKTLEVRRYAVWSNGRPQVSVVDSRLHLSQPETLTPKPELKHVIAAGSTQVLLTLNNN